MGEMPLPIDIGLYLSPQKIRHTFPQQFWSNFKSCVVSEYYNSAGEKTNLRKI